MREPHASPPIDVAIHVMSSDVFLRTEYELLESELCDAELNRARRFRSVPHRHAYVAARALQKWQFARLGVPARERGTLAADRRASLTHTDGLVACALASEGAVGVDAEWLGGVADLSAVARHALAPGEQECLRIAAPGEARELFMRFWTAKEAVSKALGQGLALPFEGIVLALDPLRVTALPPACGRPQEWHLEERRVGDHRLALALRRPEGLGVVARWETVTLERLVRGA